MMRDRPMGHLPALDGLRGLAVIAVIAHHLELLPGGYLGVDAFFVLSGFLITGLLADEIRFGGADRIDLGRFWVRRVKRLLPALAAVLAVVVVVEAIIASPGSSIRRETLAALFYVFNWNALAEGVDYWSTFSEPSPLQHMWSLAIEEQFYLVWPLVVAGIVWMLRRSDGDWRNRSVSALGAVSLALALVSLLVAQIVHDPSNLLRVYYGTDTRIAAILFGAVAAIVVRRVPELSAPMRTAIGRGGLVLVVPIGWAWFALEGTTPFLYRGGLVLIGLGVTLVITAMVLAPESAIARSMSASPLRWCGLLSYGLYLWHWPIIVWLDAERTGLDGVALFSLRMVLTVAVAGASYVLLEQPVRRSGIGGIRVAGVGALAMGGLVALTLIALTGPATRLEQPEAGTRSTMPIPDVEPSRPVATTGRDDAPTVADTDAEGHDAVTFGTTPPAPDLGQGGASAADAPTADTDDMAPAATPSLPRRVMVVGDSGGYFLGEELVAVAGDDIVVLPRGVVGCGILNEGGGSWTDGSFLPDPPGCENWAESWTADATAFRADHVLIVLSWPGIGDRELDGVRRHACEPEFDAFFGDRLALAIETAAGSGAEVSVATAPYYVGLGSDTVDRSRIDCLNDVMTTTTRAAGATLVDLASWTCPDGACRIEVDGEALRPDGLHFSGPGGRVAAGWVLDQLLDHREPAAPARPG